MIKAEKLVKVFKDGQSEFTALKGIDLLINKRDFVVITGRSGAGKSTLLYQLGLLDEPTSGRLFFNNYNISSFSDSEKTNFRLKNIGYVFQDYALVPELTALENTTLPLIMMGKSGKEAENKAKEILSGLGLKDKFHNLPNQLSGGEQQRVSVARAVVNNPKIIFADEPTANLDSEKALEVIDVFKSLQKEGQTIVMITHEEEFFSNADRIVHISDGQIENIS